MKTEKEARKTWCQETGARGTDVNGDFLPENCCIASDCMAWEWEAGKDREKTFHTHGPTPDPKIWDRVSKEAATGVWPTYRRKQQRGDCGLKRGKP